MTKRVEDLPLELPGQLSFGDLRPDYASMAPEERRRLFELKRAAISASAKTAGEYRARVDALRREMGLEGGV